MLLLVLISGPGQASPLFKRPIADWETWALGVDKPFSAPAPTAVSDWDRASLAALATRPNPAWLAKWTTTPASGVWSETALKLVVKYQKNPLRAARLLALLHVAMHDAIVAAAREKLGEAAQLAALHAAGSSLITYLFPQEVPGQYDALGYSAKIALLATYRKQQDKIAHGWHIGRAVANVVIDRALFDGWDFGWDPRSRPAAFPGAWQAAPPLNVYRPTEPRAKDWRTWVLTRADEIVVPPPTPYDSPKYWAEAREVYETHKTLMAAQKRIAEDWNLGLGTVTPPGVWNGLARKVVVEKKLNTAETARVFAALNVAMADAMIACWHVKFTHWTQRPITAIRSKWDEEFLPHVITPSFPSYTSGHSAVSGAAASVLARFFPHRAEEFHAKAAEAARSRLYGGIHFESDNREGLVLGQKVGEKVAGRLAK